MYAGRVGGSKIENGERIRVVSVSTKRDREEREKAGTVPFGRKRDPEAELSISNRKGRWKYTLVRELPPTAQHVDIKQRRDK